MLKTIKSTLCFSLLVQWTWYSLSGSTPPLPNAMEIGQLPCRGKLPASVEAFTFTAS